MAHGSFFDNIFGSTASNDKRLENEHTLQLAKDLADQIPTRGNPQPGPQLFPGEGQFEGPPQGTRGLLNPGTSTDLVTQLLNSDSPVAASKGIELLSSEISRNRQSEFASSVFGPDSTVAGLPGTVERIRNELKLLGTNPETSANAVDNLTRLQTAQFDRDNKRDINEDSILGREGIAANSQLGQDRRARKERERKTAAANVVRVESLTNFQVDAAGNAFAVIGGVFQPVPSKGDFDVGLAQAKNRRAEAKNTRQQQKADREVAKLERKQELRRSASLGVVSDVLRNVQSSLEKVGFTSTGFVGGVTAWIPGTPAFKLQAAIEGVTSNVAFEKINEMKNAAETGGALGQIAVAELVLLSSVMGSLKVGQDEGEIISNLQEVEKRFKRLKFILSKVGDVHTAPNGKRVRVIKINDDGNHDVEEVR